MLGFNEFGVVKKLSPHFMDPPGENSEKAELQQGELTQVM